uniref:MAM domain-containing protein n=1 Tax=Salarias fasciatus TaxID=181472 RepID=A0A672JN69_SALFA
MPTSIVLFAGYQLCDFEQDWCGWDNRSISSLKWIRTNQLSLSTTDPQKGPGRDHSENTAAGSFLYVTVPDDGLKQDWASFQSPPLQPTNSSHPCKMVMYTHQFGPRSGGLTVLVVDRAIYPVWERGGALGDLWVKAEVEIVTNTSFQILIMAAIRNYTYGGIAIDSILLSPECRISTETVSVEKLPDSPKDPCTDREKLCDFHADCEGQEDEAKCGDFSYPQGSSGWTDASIGSQGWTLYKTEEEEYLYVVSASGQQLTDAQTRTPLLGPTGPACTMTFDFALTGHPDHIGDLSVTLIDSVLGAGPKMFEYSGKTPADPEEWQSAEILIGFRKNRFQVAFEARAMKLCNCVRIKVKNVRFHNCRADYYPSPPTGLSCNFESGLCGWYQDNDDNFDWTELDGVDHTIGKSLVVDMWSPSLRGTFGRLISFPQPPGSTDHCLSFFYKLYGPNPGTLNVKLLLKGGAETVIWSHTGSDGNMWHEATCPVGRHIDDFQLVFEAVRSGFDGRVAIDDVSVLSEPCGMPRRCSFEGGLCGYTRSGKVPWLHLSGQRTSAHRPQSDHTLESSLGSYMLVDTSGSNLPSGETTVLVSPVRHGTSSAECLNFWYQMGGENPGSLTVYVKQIDGRRVKIFSTSLNRAGVWRHGNGNIRGTLVDWQVEFEVVGRGGRDAHIAIDDIFLSPLPCAVCTLENGLCSWSNTQNIQVDELDWELTSQEAEQHYPTPLRDHTLKTEKGHFLSLPSSDQTAAMQRAHLLSPHLPPTKGTCLMTVGDSDTQLSVWILSNGRLNQLLELSDLWESWKRFEVDIASTEEYQIVFQGIKGQSGVLALDDIQYTVGVNCELKHTDTAPQDNTGGIAASIVVVVLIIITLTVVLYYYLRNKGKSDSTPSPSANGGFSSDIYDGDDTVSSCHTGTHE